jgi:signal transduction histidine kinase
MALHEVARLLQEDTPADRWLEAVAAHLPNAWFDQEVVAARIALGDAEFTSGICPPSPVWDHVEFALADGTPGAIEIARAGNGAEGRADDLQHSLLCSLADMLRLALDRRQAREALRESYERIQELSSRLIDIEEAERAHLARELHDEFGQGLTAIRLMLSAARAKTMPDAAALKKAGETVDDLMRRVREISVALHPPLLDNLGLTQTLFWHTQRFTERTNIRVAFRHRNVDRRFPSRVELAAYRIVQESLTNIARHADVAKASVSVWASDELLFLQIEDKGKGFDPVAVGARGSGAGLFGMQERARLLGGTLTVESAPGAGATLRAELPLADAPAGDKVG